MKILDIENWNERESLVTITDGVFKIACFADQLDVRIGESWGHPLQIMLIKYMRPIDEDLLSPGIVSEVGTQSGCVLEGKFNSEGFLQVGGLMFDSDEFDWVRPGEGVRISCGQVSIFRRREII